MTHWEGELLFISFISYFLAVTKDLEWSHLGENIGKSQRDCCCEEQVGYCQDEHQDVPASKGIKARSLELIHNHFYRGVLISARHVKANITREFPTTENVTISSCCIFVGHHHYKSSFGADENQLAALKTNLYSNLCPWSPCQHNIFYPKSLILFKIDVVKKIIWVGAIQNIKWYFPSTYLPL